jgi:hypothetical protein
MKFDDKAKELAEHIGIIMETEGIDWAYLQDGHAIINGLLAAALAACARETNEECCKAMCGCCAHPEWGYGPAEEENGLWFHRNVDDGRLSGRCEAGPIRALRGPWNVQ